MDTQMTWSLQDLLYQASSTVSIVLATCRGGNSSVLGNFSYTQLCAHLHIYGCVYL